jgi:hypothetical protein
MDAIVGVDDIVYAVGVGSQGMIGIDERYRRIINQI